MDPEHPAPSTDAALSTQSAEHAPATPRENGSAAPALSGDQGASGDAREPSAAINGHDAGVPPTTPPSSGTLQEVPLDSPASEPPPIPVKSPPPPTPRSPAPSHSRASTSTTGSRHNRSLTLSQGPTVSLVLITSALDTILQSKEARRSPPFKDATQRALDMVNTGAPETFDPRVLFEPLRMACETGNEKLMIASLDCIAKLISYSFFAEPEGLRPYVSPPATPTSATHSALPLSDLIAITITSAYTESTPDPVALQIVKALLALVLSTTVVVHHSSLLKAVRTIYNVFLLSQNPSNQLVAQGGLTQIVHHVFSRCDMGIAAAENPVSAQTPKIEKRSLFSSPSTPESVPLPPITPTEDHFREDPAANIASQDSSHVDQGDIPETPVSSISDKENGDLHHARAHPPSLSTLTLSEVEPMDHHAMTTNDLYIKDAFLVFRALCKLSMKSLVTESERDLKSHGMRSKLLSLHLLLTILSGYMPIFVHPSSLLYSGSSGEKTQFLQAAKQYLCLCISRNAISSVPQVFDITVDMFWRVLSGMRSKLKKEIEVLMNEIYIPMLEMRTSTLKQKSVLLQMLSRLSQDAQALVDLYINYDCDSEALENIYERLINIVSKISSVQPHSAGKGSDLTSPTTSQGFRDGSKAVPPSLSTSALATAAEPAGGISSDATLRRQALECLVSVLRSLVAWGTTAEKGMLAEPVSASDPGSSKRLSTDGNANTSSERLTPSISHDLSRVTTPDLPDDPDRFANAKQRKTILLEGIKRFNFKPKRGIQYLRENGFLGEATASEIAQFLLATEGLSKSMIGEYLGEGDEENVAIMHAFVDSMDFTELVFTEALRNFLQSFRLPGEAQKIDRFMLKYAERYIACNTQTVFKNAEAAYVLAYSVILLNTDAHNPQIKRRMTKADFIKNNRGINDGTDLPEDMLSNIYDEIQGNEIRMRDEVEQGALMALSQTGSSGLAASLANVGRDVKKEAYITQTTGILNRTEAMFRTMTRSKPSTDLFFSATHYHHVKPMFEVAWMAFLAGLSGPLQDTDDLEVVELCLDGFKSSIHIVCFFDLDLQRTSFVTTLAKFTFLNNLGEMKTKNMEAIKSLLDVAVNEGNTLKGCWRDVLTCVSQLERMQLIGSKADPSETKRSRKKLPAEELANESRSTHITVAADMVFSLSRYLSGTAIVDFVQALSDISWEEIQSSGQSDAPRLFSLQKLVEISYYNMNRIRLEWSSMWAILGEHFNMICCHSNPHVAFFSLDALRQLAMRFLEKEELPHFKFQKDFLRPFQHTMIHNPSLEARDMVLQCLQQMIQAKAQNLRSGWRTMFSVFSAASRVHHERIATSAFEIVTQINKLHFESIVRNGAFADMTVCITDFCKANRYQKVSLLAIGMLRRVIPAMLESPECMVPVQPASEGASTQAAEDATVRFWFPVLFSFYDIIMNGEDLEVRQMALDSLFVALKKYGTTFSPDFWDTVFRELLFPIFAILRSPADVSRFSTQEDTSVWFSTTMVEALRNLVDLYSFYFETLGGAFDGLLELLQVCICQENDTIARIGTSCLQKLLENNVQKFSHAQWERLITAFVTLFKMTTPHQLFDENLRVEIPANNAAQDVMDDPPSSAILPAPLPPEAPLRTDLPNPIQARRRIFQQIIVKCVLQLLLIETTYELLQNSSIYETMPPDQLLRLMGVLDHSYQFARSFNEDKDLRTGLWRVGFMKHLPNLLKQESASASALVNILLRMYYDTRQGHLASRPQVADRLLPLGLGIMKDYNKLRTDTNMKSIMAWSPVIGAFLRGVSGFEDGVFKRYLPVLYTSVVELLAREMPPEIREASRHFFLRVGKIQGIADI